MIPTSWTPVTSSNIAALKWEDGSLHVRYRDGAEHAIEGVGPEEAESVLHASSVGKAVHALRKSKGKA